MKRLYYIRHGLSEANKQGVFAGGSLDSPLAPEGRDGAKKAAVELKDAKIDLILASPLKRVRETAEIIAKEIGYPVEKIQFTPLLKERALGVMDGRPYSVKLSRSFVDDNLPEGLEPWSSLLKRGEQLLAELERMNADNILLVGSGANGRALRKVINPDSDQHAAIPNSELMRWI